MTATSDDLTALPPEVREAVERLKGYRLHGLCEPPLKLWPHIKPEVTALLTALTQMQAERDRLAPYLNVSGIEKAVAEKEQAERERDEARVGVAELEAKLVVERNLVRSAFRAENAKQRALDVERERAEQAEAENEHLRKSLDAVGRYHPTKEFCDVCYAEVDRGVNGDWYWHFHRSRDRRGGVYCHDCGPLKGTLNQDDIPCPCPCDDCVGIDKRISENLTAYDREMSENAVPTEPLRRAEQAEADLQTIKALLDEVEQRREG